MALAAAGLFEYLLPGPVEITEVIGQKDTRKKSRRTRSAAHSKRYFVVQLKVQPQSKDAAYRKDIQVGGKDEIVFQLRAHHGVSARSVDMKILRNRGIDRQVKSHSQTNSVEAGPKVGRRRRQPKMQGLALRVWCHAGWG